MSSGKLLEDKFNTNRLVSRRWLSLMVVSRRTPALVAEVDEGL